MSSHGEPMDKTQLTNALSVEPCPTPYKLYIWQHADQREELFSQRRASPPVHPAAPQQGHSTRMPSVSPPSGSLSANANVRNRYRGRLAPSPTGLLHLGHARTFWIAAQRAKERAGTLVLRNEDLDPQRCRPEFAEAMIEDLQWLGIRWREGSDCGGPFAPYVQSARRRKYLAAWRTLR